MISTPRGLISFIGAGPGAPDLITLRGARRLSEADLIIWASSLIPRELLDHARDGVEIHDSATMTLEDVIEIYHDNPAARIARLHSGDPSIYGAMQEQIDWCIAEARSFEIIPGVSSLSAAAASIQRELTIPGTSQSIVLTRLPSRTSSSAGPNEDLAKMSAIGCTMAVFLSAARPAALKQRLLSEGSAYNEDTPVAVVSHASWPEEKVVISDLGHLDAAIKNTGSTTTVLVLVGDFIASRPQRSHLYSPDFAHKFRRRSLKGSSKGRPSGRS
jgi:precorrin-4/cobalt-precorrin-4 C11-methyltransferase